MSPELPLAEFLILALILRVKIRRMSQALADAIIRDNHHEGTGVKVHLPVLALVLREHLLAILLQLFLVTLKVGVLDILSVRRLVFLVLSLAKTIYHDLACLVLLVSELGLEVEFSIFLLFLFFSVFFYKLGFPLLNLLGCSV
jgi:hypothetical protein